MKTITITGPVRSGKTTKANALKKKLEGEGKKVLINEGGERSEEYIEQFKPDVMIVTKI